MACRETEKEPTLGLDSLRAEAAQLIRIRKELDTKPRRRRSRGRAASQPPPGEAELAGSLVPPLRNASRNSPKHRLSPSPPTAPPPAPPAEPPHGACPSWLSSRDRQELFRWVETLCLEVTRLEREKLELERRLVEARTAQKQLELQVQQLRTIRENSTAGAASQTRGYSSSGQAFTSDPLEVQRRLLASTAEVQLVRKENAEIKRALHDSKEELKRMSIECQGLMVSIKELESLQENDPRYAAMEDRLKALAEEKKVLEEMVHDARVQVDVVGTSLHLAQDRNHEVLHQAEKSVAEARTCAAEAEKAAGDKQHNLDELRGLVHPLAHALANLQDKFISQTREFVTFISKVRTQQSVAQIATEDTHAELDAQREDARNLYLEVIRLRAEHQRSQSDADKRLQYEQSISYDLGQKLQSRARNFKSRARNSKSLRIAFSTGRVRLQISLGPTNDAWHGGGQDGNSAVAGMFHRRSARYQWRIISKRSRKMVPRGRVHVPASTSRTCF